jgi:hypothetical protein
MPRNQANTVLLRLNTGITSLPLICAFSVFVAHFEVVSLTKLCARIMPVFGGFLSRSRHIHIVAIRIEAVSQVLSSCGSVS